MKLKCEIINSLISFEILKFDRIHSWTNNFTSGSLLNVLSQCVFYVIRLLLNNDGQVSLSDQISVIDERLSIKIFLKTIRLTIIN